MSGYAEGAELICSRLSAHVVHLGSPVICVLPSRPESPDGEKKRKATASVPSGSPALPKSTWSGSSVTKEADPTRKGALPRRWGAEMQGHQ